MPRNIKMEQLDAAAEAALRETEEMEKQLSGDAPQPAVDNTAQVEGETSPRGSLEQGPSVSLMASVPPNPMISPDMDPVALESAARLLLLQVPKTYRQILEDVALNYKLPLWQLVCGNLSRQGEQGQLTDFVLDPAWGGMSVHAGMSYHDVVCDGCKQRFQPTRRGQTRCCNACSRKLEGGPNQYPFDHNDNCLLRKAA